MKPGAGRLSLLLLSFLFVSFVYSQKNFQPGYLVTAANDTVRGFIDYRNWEKNPLKIEFCRSVSETPATYVPFQLKMFTVGNEVYETAIVTMDDSPFKTENLTEGAALNYVTDTVFLLNLVEGSKSLLYFMDSKSKEHFFIRNGQRVDLLFYKRYLKRDDSGGLTVVEDKRYKGQLILYLQECSSIQLKLSNTSYEKRSLVRLFLEYYKCSGEKIVKQNKAVSKPLEFGVFAGLSFTKFGFIDGPLYFQGVSYPVSKNFTAGLVLNFLFPRSFGRLSVHNELQYSSFKVEGTYHDQYNTTITSLGMEYLQMNNMLRYMYPVNKAFCFVNAGISSGFGIRETNHKKQTSTASPPVITEGNALAGLNPSYLGIPVGAGLKYRHFSLEARYQSGFKKQDDLNAASHPNSSTSSLLILLGYQF